jgi:hypothetical protein
LLDTVRTTPTPHQKQRSRRFKKHLHPVGLLVFRRPEMLSLRKCFKSMTRIEPVLRNKQRRKKKDKGYLHSLSENCKRFVARTKHCQTNLVAWRPKSSILDLEEESPKARDADSQSFLK